eukprot:SAG31_NODE_3276_length_4474_cov_11.371429_2_plen_237_part_00
MKSHLQALVQQQDVLETTIRGILQEKQMVEVELNRQSEAYNKEHSEKVKVQRTLKSAEDTIEANSAKIEFYEKELSSVRNDLSLAKQRRDTASIAVQADDVDGARAKLSYVENQARDFERRHAASQAELATVRDNANARAKEAHDLREEFAETKQSLQEEIDRLKKGLAMSDSASSSASESLKAADAKLKAKEDLIAELRAEVQALKSQLLEEHKARDSASLQEVSKDQASAYLSA